MLVWLGGEADNSNLVFESLAIYRKGGQATAPAASNDLIAPLRRSDVSLAMADLCSRPYWRRTWIMQEIVLAPEILLYCGRCKIEWDMLADVLRTLRQWKEDNTGLDNTSVDTREFWTIIANSKATRLVLQRDFGVRETSLLKLIVEFRDMECTDIRDSIYGLFRLLAPGALKIDANYALSAVGLFLKVMDIFKPLGLIRIGHLLYEVLGLRDYEHNINALLARNTVQPYDSTPMFSSSQETVRISTYFVGTVVKSAAAPLSTGPRIRRNNLAFSTILPHGGVITKRTCVISSSAIGCYTKRLLRTGDKVFQVGDTDIVIIVSPGDGAESHDDHPLEYGRFCNLLHYGLLFRGESAVDFHRRYKSHMDRFFEEVDRFVVGLRASVAKTLENEAIELQTATFLRTIGLGGFGFDISEWKRPLSSEAVRNSSS